MGEHMIGALLSVLGRDSFWDFNIIEVVTLVGGMAVVIFGGCKWAWERCYGLPRSFVLSYSKYPKESPLDVQLDSWSMPVGIHDVEVLVKVRYGINISQFNIRCVRTESGSNELASIVSIDKMEDAETPITSINALQDRDDSKGGRTGLFNPPNQKSPGESLRLRLKFNAKQPWHGYLSFRGYDKNNNKRFAVCPLTIMKETYSVTESEGLATG